MDGNKKLIWTLIVVILLLVVALVYVLAIRPAISGYVVDQQNRGIVAGYNQALLDLLAQINQNGYAQIPVGNQTLYLAPIQ